MDYLQGFYIDWVKELYYGGKRKFASQGLQTSRHKFRGLKRFQRFLKKAADLFPRKVDWKWLITTLLVGIILGLQLGSHSSIKPETGIKPVSYKHLHPLAIPSTKKLAPVALKPVPPPAPVVSYTPAPVVTSCPIITSSDPYVQDVLNVESGGNTCAMNPSGACGAFQRLPCTVPLGNASVQLADGLAYIASTYGSSYNAWLHELNYGWY